jgi:oxygen-dependent protoporphyrinogen oxidase
MGHPPALQERSPVTQGNIDAIVVGGGVSGLTAAFYLQKRGFTVEVLEAADRTGGVIASHRRDGVLWESGPNSTLDTTPLINETLEAAGILGERLDGSAASSRRFVIKGAQPVALPGSAGAFAATGLFSLGAKLRLFKEPFIAPSPAELEETVADFVRRRLGREFLDYAIEPFVSGIYAGDPELLSVRAAFPKLHALEQRYGSLIKGQILGARERKRRGMAAANTAKSFSFREGMQTLTDALARGVERIEFGVRVTRLTRDSGGVFRIAAERGNERLERRAQVVVLAVPASEAARIVAEVAPEASRALAAIEYNPVAVVASAYRREDIAHPLDGFGFLAPGVEGRAVLGTLFSTSMFDGRAKPGTVLLTTFVGGRRNPAIAAAPRDEIERAVFAEHAALLGAKALPLWCEITRWPLAIPQYALGHLVRIGAVERAEAALPGLYFCSGYRGGVAVGDRIRNGHGIAASAAALLAGAESKAA